MALIKLNSRAIPDDTVVEADIADGSVTSAKLDTNIAVGSLSTSSDLAVGGDLRVKGTEPDDAGRLLIRVNDTEVLFQGNESSAQTDKSFAFFGGNQGIDQIVTLRGRGINFGSDTADANLLDDYEEGTWIPAFYATGGTPTISYDSQVGYYTKIGNQVFYRIYLATSSVSGGSGDLYIIGLPFTANTSYSGQIIGLTYGWATNPAGVAVTVGGSTNTLYLYRPDNAASSVPVSWLGTGSGSNRIIINGFFETTA